MFMEKELSKLSIPAALPNWIMFIAVVLVGYSMILSQNQVSPLPGHVVSFNQQVRVDLGFISNSPELPLEKKSQSMEKKSYNLQKKE